MNNVDNDCNFQNTEKYLYLGANLIQWNDSKVLTCFFFKFAYMAQSQNYHNAQPKNSDLYKL